MRTDKRWARLGILFFTAIFIGLLNGCATTSQITELQAKVDQALQEVQNAQERITEVEAKCSDNKAEAEEYYKGVKQAADRAEAAAANAASAEKSAIDSAKRAEVSAEDTRVLYDRMMSK